MRLHDAFAQLLCGCGIDTVFGLMGDANMLYLSAYKEIGGRFVGVAHEGSSVGAADAWARATGQVGIASVTHGPALTNTMTSLIEAARAHTPLVVLTGSTPIDPTHFQRVDIAAVAAAGESGFERVHAPKTVARDLRRALRRARAERRPIVLDLPIHMLRADVEEPTEVPPLALPAPVAPHRSDLERAIERATAARRPVVLAGRGVVEADAENAVSALADALGAPLATTLLGQGLFRGHPDNIGVCGTLSHAVAVNTLAEADFVLAIGASLNSYTSAGRQIFADKTVVQVDADAAALGWYLEPDVGLCGDAELTAETMISILQEVEHRPASGWRDGVRRALAEHDPRADVREQHSDGRIDPRIASAAVEDLLPEQRNLISDIGRFTVSAWPWFSAPEGRVFTTMGAFGSIGLGAAGALGLSIARPDDVTVLLVGDGGLSMALAELPTLAREGGPIVVVLYNDGAYGAEHVKLTHFGVDPRHSMIAWPEFVPLARAAGGDGAVVASREDVEAVADRLRSPQGLFVLDVRVDPEFNVGH
jgi:thiamine pyrophosphate-dependent acetolactate synthase large subunit-like protein